MKMNENDGPVAKKRKYGDFMDDWKTNNPKNIPIETKGDIEFKKKQLRKIKREKKKQATSAKKGGNKESCTPHNNVPFNLNGDNKDSCTLDVVKNKRDNEGSFSHSVVKKKKDNDDSLASNVRIKQDNEDSLSPGVVKNKKNNKGSQSTGVVKDELDTKDSLSPVVAGNKIDCKESEGSFTPVSGSSMFCESSNKSVVNFAPSGINVYQYAESRAYEIMNLQHALKEAQCFQNTRVFQTLPRHMRRRAASHDIKRIPRRLRHRAENEKVVPKKPPTRKYKRRPKNLMEEYNRRRKLHSWLETHMWHAKRFKMVDSWGYRLPEKPCDKAFRAIYRASAKSCLLQDKSYMEFIEIIGSQQIIISGLERITNSNSINGGIFKDEKCLSGQCYGEEVIYTHDSYPYQVIGCAKFIWGPAQDISVRKLIIICHPSISLQLMKEIHIIFDICKPKTLEKVDVVSDKSIAPNIKENINPDELIKSAICDSRDEDMEKTFEPVDLTNTETANVDNLYLDQKIDETDDCTITDIDDDNLDSESKLNIISERVVIPCTEEDSNISCQCPEKIHVEHHKLDFIMLSLTGPLSFSLLKNIFTFPEDGLLGNDEYNSKETKGDEKWSGNIFWQNNSFETICKKTAALYSLYVEDPRFHIPYKKQNPFCQSKSRSVSTSTNTNDVYCSPPSLLWNKLARNNVKDGKLSDGDINNMRYQLLVPGSTLPVKSAEIPVVVMQRSATNLYSDSQDHRKSVYGCGFDIILPSGWAMPFWIALIYQGARVGGIQADENIALEALSTYFPAQYPDSKACQEHIAVLRKEKEQKYKRYPPDKRMNYNKLGIRHPFTIPWSHLVSEWKHIIKLLLCEDQLIKNCSKSDNGFYVLRQKTFLYQLKLLLNGKVGDDYDRDNIIKEMLNYPDSVICVHVNPCYGGVPKENAILCIPTLEDFSLLNVTKNHTDESFGVKEPMHKGLKCNFPYICKKYDILLPNAVTIGGNSRWVIGYVQNGSYSYTRGQGSGVGFVSMIGLVYLLKVNKDLSLLFRNINSLEYSFCNIDILI